MIDTSDKSSTDTFCQPFLQHAPCLWIHISSVLPFSRSVIIPHLAPRFPSPPSSLTFLFPSPSLSQSPVGWGDTSSQSVYLLKLATSAPLSASPLFSCVLPASAASPRERAACVVLCSVTLLCRQPKSMHQSRETLLPQLKNGFTRVSLTSLLHTWRLPKACCRWLAHLEVLRLDL